MTNDEYMPIYTLLSDIGELDSELAILTAQRDKKRALLSVLVESQGGRVDVQGVDRAEIRAPVVVESFDKDALTELIQSLSESGYASIADEIRACIKRSARAGGLMVIMERKP